MGGIARVPADLADNEFSIPANVVAVSTTRTMNARTAHEGLFGIAGEDLRRGDLVQVDGDGLLRKARAD